MFRLSILLVLLTSPTKPARVADTRSLVDMLGKLNQKLEKITVAPLEDKIYAKLDKLNSLSPEKFELSDETEEVLSKIQVWTNAKLTPKELYEFAKDQQGLRDETDDEKNDRLNEQDYGDSDWNDEDIVDLAEGENYPNDKDWDTDNDVDSSATMKPILGVTPSAFTRLDNRPRHTIISAVDPIAATNARPRILDDLSLSKSERSRLRKQAYENIAKVMSKSMCLTPQPRWLTVRQMAPAADTIYLPPCVELHRCAPDTGCCDKSDEICAPISGEYVAIPFYLHKADATTKVARIQFFNHTQCGCVSRETLQSTMRTRIDRFESQESSRDLSSERQNDWRSPTEEPKLDRDDTSEPPQLRRCTCPTLFKAIYENDSCSCLCQWSDNVRRRDCLSLARGREHFGMKERVCVKDGICTSPTCDYGNYDINNGSCPTKRYRKSKYHSRARYLSEKTVVV